VTPGLRAALIALAGAREAEALALRALADEPAGTGEQAPSVGWLPLSVVVERHGLPLDWLRQQAKAGKLEVRLVGRAKFAKLTSVAAAIEAAPLPRSVKPEAAPDDEVAKALAAGRLRVVGGRRK
jgi:hypothetical protein